MDVALSDVIRLAGAGQLCVLVASALVPAQLRWKQELAPLPRLLRQLARYGVPENSRTSPD